MTNPNNNYYLTEWFVSGVSKFFLLRAESEIHLDIVSKNYLERDREVLKFKKFKIYFIDLFEL